MSVAKDIEEAKGDALIVIGSEISYIINQPDTVSDGQVIDQIVTLLRQYKIYIEK